MFPSREAFQSAYPSCLAPWPTLNLAPPPLRVGESAPRTTNARIIAATNIDLRRALAQGRFREDLFYRLCVVPIEIPPLRERREDIAALANHLLVNVTSQHNLVKRLSPQAMKVLLDYPWPGNVRELANAMEYAVAVSKSETILPEDLPLVRAGLEDGQDDVEHALRIARWRTRPSGSRRRARRECGPS